MAAGAPPRLPSLLLPEGNSSPEETNNCASGIPIATIERLYLFILIVCICLDLIQKIILLQIGKINMKLPAVFFINTSIVCLRPGIPWRMTGSIVE